MFTYLIGREVTFADRMRWIACSNKGRWRVGRVAAVLRDDSVGASQRTGSVDRTVSAPPSHLGKSSQKIKIKRLP